MKDSIHDEDEQGGHISRSLWLCYENFSQRHPILTELLLLGTIVGICAIGDFTDNADLITACCAITCAIGVLYYWVFDTSDKPSRRWVISATALVPPIPRWRDLRCLHVIIGLGSYWSARVGNDYIVLSIIQNGIIPITCWGVILFVWTSLCYAAFLLYASFRETDMLKRPLKIWEQAVLFFTAAGIIGGSLVYCSMAFGLVNALLFVPLVLCYLPIVLLAFIVWFALGIEWLFGKRDKTDKKPSLPFSMDPLGRAFAMRSVYFLAEEYSRFESYVAALTPEQVAEYEQFRATTPTPAFSLIRGIWSARSKIARHYRNPCPAIEQFRKQAVQFSLQLALNFNPYQYLDRQHVIKLSRKLAKEFDQFTFEVGRDILKCVIECETLESKLAERHPELVADCERLWGIYHIRSSFERFKSEVAELSPEWATLFEQIRAERGENSPSPTQ